MVGVGVPRRENQIVAQVQEGDTLQAICLRYNCSVSIVGNSSWCATFQLTARWTFQLAELKRLNKIEKEIEIHARTTLRIPVTPFTVLLDTLPGVHSSGNSSPKHAATAPSAQHLLNNNPLLDEKLMIASVSNSSAANTSQAHVSESTTINDIILESKITPSVPQYHDRSGTDLTTGARELHARVPLLSGEMDDSVPQPRPIPVRHRFEVNFNGTDCDMSWVCLFIFILLLCVAIPLIYVFWTVEHVDHHHGVVHSMNSSSAHNIGPAGGGGLREKVAI